MSYRRVLGNEGEEIACQYLQKKGYHIRERQWRSRTGEIDIIAEKDGVFVFIETRATIDTMGQGSPRGLRFRSPFQ